MNKNNELTSLLGEVPALTQNAEGQLRGGFTAFKGDDGIAVQNNDTGCSSNEDCHDNGSCSDNHNCHHNTNCSHDTDCSYQKNQPQKPGGGGPLGPTGKPGGGS